MAEKITSKREKSKEKLLIGILIIILGSGINALALDVGAFGLFIDCLGFVGILLMIFGVVGLIKNPKS